MTRLWVARPSYRGSISGKAKIFSSPIRPDRHWAQTSYSVIRKVKQSRNRPSVAQSVPGDLRSHISMTLSTWRWWGCQTHAPAAFTTQEMFLVLIFTRGCVDPRAMVRSEGNMSLKNPVTPPGIDPETVRIVAQRLNHYANPGPSTQSAPEVKGQGHWASDLNRMQFFKNYASIPPIRHNGVYRHDYLLPSKKEP